MSRDRVLDQAIRLLFSRTTAVRFVTSFLVGDCLLAYGVTRRPLSDMQLGIATTFGFERAFLDRYVISECVRLMCG